MAAPGTLSTVRRVLSLRRRALRMLQAELGRSARSLADLDRQRERLAGVRATLFAGAGRAFALDALCLADVEREWLSWLGHRRDAEREHERLEGALARMRAEIRALEVYANRLAVVSR